MKGFLLGMWLLLTIAPHAISQPSLTFTAPSLGQKVWMEWDEIAGDSTRVVECYGTTPIAEILKIYLYGQRLEGGGFHRVDSVMVTPGSQGVFWPAFYGSFYATARNSKGESCADSTLVYLLPPIRTDVPITDILPTITLGDRALWLMFDVRGRIIEHSVRIASGVYWLKEVKRPWIKARRIVIVH